MEGTAMLGWGGGGWRGLVEEGQAEGGGGGAFTCGAAVGALPWADGLQHTTLALFQHVLLRRE